MPEVIETNICRLLTVQINSSFYTNITTENSTGSSQTKDFLAAFGTYNPSTGSFSIAFSFLSENVGIGPGTDTNTLNCQALQSGSFDVLSAIGTYNSSTGSFTMESSAVAEDALTIPEVTEMLYERYNTGEDHAAGVYGRYWKGQTFTIGNTGENENHNITSVKLKLFRQGSPGIITVHIRATSGGKPIGSDLTSGTTNGNTLTTSYAGEWREIVLTPCELSANTQYALIVSDASGDSSNRLAIKEDQTSPTYTGGSAIHSSQSGTTWETENKDLMFEEYGF